MKSKKAFFSISAVAKMFSVHQQTIRLYEKEGFISPKRSEGNTRLFSEKDIEKLEKIIYLTHQLGINLAGVEIIFKLQKKIKVMQNEIDKLIEKLPQKSKNAQKISSILKRTNKELEIESNIRKKEAQKNASQLVKIKKERKNVIINKNKSDNGEKVFDIDDWEVEYEEW